MSYSYIWVRIVSNAKPSSLYSRNEIALLQTFSGNPSDLHFDIKSCISLLSDFFIILVKDIELNTSLSTRNFITLGMQGKKNYSEKLFVSFQLSSRVPKENFYRRLMEVVDLKFLYKDTSELYGKTGNPSIDPVVFFKLMLAGYLENITSDRKLVEHCAMRMDILFFLGYDIDEQLPWHSTISRTRQLYPDAVFETLFNKVFSMCVHKGMVSGHTQAIDSAPVKANASMESLELKSRFNLLKITSRL